jgi:hypothetical protein
MKKLIFLLFLVVGLQAATIQGEGVNKNPVVAKKEALSDISSQISSKVTSEYKSYQAKLGDQYKESKEKIINVSTNLPIKGAKFETIKEKNDCIKIIATLDKNSLKVYEESLRVLKDNIDNLKNKTDYDSLELLLEKVQKFYKHKIVAIAIGGKNLPMIDVLESDIKLKLKKFSRVASNIDVATEILAKKFQEKKIYLVPPKVVGSSEITQFAHIFAKNLSKYINCVSKPVEADYTLRGQYEILKDSIFVSYNLYDENDSLIKTNTIQVKKNPEINHNPETKSFDSSLMSDKIINNDLRVKIGFQGFYQENGISLKNGDLIKIAIKSNKDICYFLLGNVLSKDEKYSYILVLNETNKLFTYLTGEEVNRPVIIVDDAVITEPFGHETLTIFISTFKDKCPLKLPKCNIDKNKGICKIEGDPIDIVRGLRAINRLKFTQKNKTNNMEENYSSDNSISWTSFKE